MEYVEEIEYTQPRSANRDTAYGTLYGIGVGLAAGLLFAYFQEGKYGISAIVGSVTGGLFARLLLIENK